jgi:diguanylate cyclase (GGDEF)-like protein
MMVDQIWPRQHRDAVPIATQRISPDVLMASEPLLALAGIGAWMYESGGGLWWSAQTRRIHGVGPEFVPVLEDAIRFYAPEDRDAISDLVRDAVLNGAQWDTDLSIIRADGVRRRVRVRGRRAERAPGEPLSVLGTFEDITDQYEAAARAEAELARRTEAETLLTDVINGIPAALSVYDADERLVLVNENYRGVMPGNATLMVIGNTLESIIRSKVKADHYVPEVSKDDPEAKQEAWMQDYLARHREPGYNRIFHLDNDKWMQATAAQSTSGNIVSIRTDVSALKRAERELRRRTEEDPLTGLANREVLMARLAALDVDGRPGMLVLIDVDFFKAVNDGMGHPSGDLLLRLLGRRLSKTVRDNDLAARLAGDEFAAIIYGLDDEDAFFAFGQKLNAALRKPVRLNGNRYTPSLSIGMAPFPMANMTAKRLLANADAALYEAKRLGRSRQVLFDSELAARVRRRTELAADLRRAVAGGRIQVALQPQMRLADGRIIGFEALARWHNRGKLLTAGEFVGLADDIGLATPFGAAVLDKALAAFGAMLQAGLEPGVLAVNVSTVQMLSDDFLTNVRQGLARHQVPPQRLEVEVTETVLLDRSIARIGQTLASLRGLGVRLALDDFGTGYAALSHLGMFKVDRIKIDKSFVDAIDGPLGDGPVEPGLIARTLIALGHGMGLEVIAEGVETPAQQAFLAVHRCDAIQGYLIGHPMLPNDALAWLRQQRRG